MKSKGKKHILSKLIMNVIAIIISITCIFPLFWMVYSSLKGKNEFMIDTLSLPTKLIFDNYPKAFNIGNLWNAIGNSAGYALLNVALVAFASVVTAYFFARFEFKGKKTIRTIYLLGILIPLYALLVPVFVQYRLLHLINTRISIIISYYAMCIPLGIFLTESFIEGIPIDIDEAAIIDGSSIFTRLTKIIFPLCKPILATVSILTLLTTWNEFAFAVILTPAKELHTVSVALSSYSTGLELDYTFLMAALVSTSIPIVLLYLIFSKYVIQGMTAGAVKG